MATTLTTLAKDRRYGGFTVGLQGTTSRAEDFIKFGTAVAHLLGTSKSRCHVRYLLRRFSVRHTDDGDSYLRQAYRLFTMHTDRTFVSEATDWLLMMKFVEQNAVGGESRFLHLDGWESCPEFYGHRLGSKPFIYKAPASKNVAENIERPLFFHGKFGLSMSFIDQFVQSENREEASFLHAVSASMEQSSGTKEVALPVGDMVVLNNYFYVHGRAPFRRNEALSRELMRQRETFSG